MFKSMTAYGRATGNAQGKDILIEIKSVNSRYFDCTVKISRMYGFLEEKIKSYVQSHGITRGKVEVYVSINLTENIGAEVKLDEAYTASYINALKNLRDKFSLSDDISVMTVAANRDIFTQIRAEEDTERDWADILPTLDCALEQFDTMRTKEGENLRHDIILKKEKLVSLAGKINEQSPMTLQDYRTRLEAKLRSTLEAHELHIDDSRILTECAVFADKIAVDEELVRLASHFKAFDEMMKTDSPIGKKIDFLLQEMNREVNTTGSKCNDSEIARLVVEMKCELEKIREQIQNIE